MMFRPVLSFPTVTHLRASRYGAQAVVVTVTGITAMPVLTDEELRML